jgi:hypothetical protein
MKVFTWILTNFNYWYYWYGCILLIIGFILIGSQIKLISYAGVLVIGGGIFSFIKKLNMDKSSQAKFDLKYWIVINVILIITFIMVIVAHPIPIYEIIIFPDLMFINFLFFVMTIKVEGD